jgi:DNA adenine methylase
MGGVPTAASRSPLPAIRPFRPALASITVEKRRAESGERTADSSRPLLKWAGGKRQLLPTIRAFYPANFTRYIEPFFGSGAVFFDLYGSGLLAKRRARLVDANPDLVGCYQTLRDQTEAVIAELQTLAEHHRVAGEALFYEVRDRRFNPARLRASASAGQAPTETYCGYTPQLAAMLIYLNRTGFNGLFRLNRRGEFNVPVGRYVNPSICDTAHLRSVAAALRQPGVSIERGSFETSIEAAGAGDFVYCDPPYEPLTPTSNFASYTANGFTSSDQARLQREIVAAARRGAHIVLSNSSAPLIVSLYTSADARRAGLWLRRVPARRSINSRATLRGPVDEVIVSNADPRLLKVALAPKKMARASLKP